ncbi:23S rRNA (adenine(2503)-C(2))-methyltransferase RlmN [Aquirufa ecclesiirivi]|uniref:Probable dual-specificity RNA methyltransferase RlmN n=1 Tax=Aquirufa ecclesiirivi TaxID=2715124 RepID=A0ABT4JGC0_9BACT|nr:23S rRNA (adenine(2503)-C(2))-methyltransferase RlmN [Aquirufa ecclesiirivi]MCZ2473384.1 23S rRNA (adenine(2503)-C(2))-methyltransferase RlmN [Aquirufa ecclesiirivi]MCZ2475167.1 23S rRNA (adenine(2503)-C(2))-methyltransferase RlmN [Aquirufa ecclesiirivi]MDF0692416.1 23S rRNA (adenine(2503)-C(2))-methyltransferase RlmN [Aquirufa ecclesiirivi]NHC48201.1 23S rRNA (adenine(2503)-C(2))-methyltransferase RlmN [Aquirufa ecclesiirivi]
MSEIAKKEELGAIRKLSLDELKQLMIQHGDPAFRAKQVHEWIWKKSARSFDAMGNIPKTTREWLNQHFSLQCVQTDDMQISTDRTIKSSFKLHDGHLVEGVLIPTRERMTACVSSQVGCSLTCSFCATGYMDRKRNLESYEIYDQVVLIRDQAQEKYGIPLTNIVYMGMGEPLLNYANVLKSIEEITSPDGLGMSPKRITVSTAGIAKMIKKLGDDQVKFNLALSLHAANDTKRNQIMPINETNTLVALAEALRYFYDKTENEITLEYIMFNKFNDSVEDAKELWEFARKLPCKINIIEYNPIAQASFVNAEADALAKFTAFLESKKMIVNVRRSRGKDIDAACGQLAGKKTA